MRVATVSGIARRLIIAIEIELLDGLQYNWYLDLAFNFISRLKQSLTIKLQPPLVWTSCPDYDTVRIA